MILLRERHSNHQAARPEPSAVHETPELLLSQKPMLQIYADERMTEKSFLGLTERSRKLAFSIGLGGGRLLD